MMKQFPDNIVLFDGQCGLCTASVQFIIRRDRRGVFRFASVQSEVGRELCRHHGLDPDRVDSVVLIQRDKTRVRSDAVLAIARELGGLWPCLAVFRVMPRAVRDCFYRLVARNRLRWFGRNATCLVPSHDDRSRFLL
jgi:predicted DCC family thiol-disulfide oxidoreductase YuxK